LMSITVAKQHPMWPLGSNDRSDRAVDPEQLRKRRPATSGSRSGSGLAGRCVGPAGSAIPAYLGRLLTSGGAAGSAVFHRLYEASKDTLAAMAATGTATAGEERSGGLHLARHIF
jgi:hypothetical protein